MSYFATVTFDLVNADSTDYTEVTDGLSNLGLYKQIRKDGKDIDLPSNTYCGEFKGESASDVRDYLNEQIKRIFRDARRKCKFFISVGSSWSWVKGGV